MEDSGNIVRIHDKCAEERRKQFQAKHTIDDVEVGDWVKKKFADEHGSEHAWVKVTGKAGSVVHGVVDNDLVLVVCVRDGDKVDVQFDEIEEICGKDD